MYTRNDGNFTVFTVQTIHGDKWGFLNMDSLGTPPATTDDFSSCGECWQQTGKHGVFDIDAAWEGLKWFRSKHKDRKFRMVEVSISQSVSVL